MTKQLMSHADVTYSGKRREETSQIPALKPNTAPVFFIIPSGHLHTPKVTETLVQQLLGKLAKDWNMNLVHKHCKMRIKSLHVPLFYLGSNCFSVNRYKQMCNT